MVRKRHEETQEKGGGSTHYLLRAVGMNVAVVEVVLEAGVAQDTAHWVHRKDINIFYS